MKINRLAMLIPGILLVLGLTVGCSAQDPSRPASQTSASQSAPQVQAPATADILPPAGWTEAVASLPPNGTEATSGGLRIQVVGDCTSRNGSGMVLKGSGGTPNGKYLARVENPDGTPYSPYDGIGRFDKDGQPSGWDWNCSLTNTGQTDPPGDGFKLYLKDLTTSVEVVATFAVKY